jgi:hypothetical protein
MTLRIAALLVSATALLCACATAENRNGNQVIESGTSTPEELLQRVKAMCEEKGMRPVVTRGGSSGSSGDTETITIDCAPVEK